MKAIETQFRKGEISYLEYKPDLEEDKSKSPTSRNNERGKHIRKPSVLTKDIMKNYTRSMLVFSINFLKEVNLQLQRLELMRVVRRLMQSLLMRSRFTALLIGISITNILQDTSQKEGLLETQLRNPQLYLSQLLELLITIHHVCLIQLLVASEFDNTTRRVESFMNNDLNSFAHEIKGTFIFIL